MGLEGGDVSQPAIAPPTFAAEERRSRKGLKLLAWALGISCFVATGAALTLHRLHAFSPGEEPWTAETYAAIVAFLAFPVVGSIIASNRPGNILGWIYLAVGVSQNYNALLDEYSRFALLRPEPLPFGAVATYIAEWAWLLGFMGLIVIILLFPDGKPPTRRWWWVAWLVGAAATLTVVGVLDLMKTPAEDLVRGLEPTEPWYAQAIFPLLSVAILGALVSLIVRFIRSRGVERQQLKWLAYGETLMVTLLLSDEFIFGPLGIDSPIIDASTIGGLILLPVSTAIAIMRYRLYEIDRIINRTVVYLTSTGTLLLVYLSTVVSLQRTFDPVRGDSDIAVVVSTLAAAALFAPLRRRVQSFVDRRFYRRRYDTQQTLEEFGSRLRDELDIEDLKGELRSVVDTTMQPTHSTLWLRGVVQ